MFSAVLFDCLAVAANVKQRPQLPERYDSPREAAEFFRLKRLPEGATELPIEKYFEAQERMRLMPQYSTAEDRMLPARHDAGTTMPSRPSEWPRPIRT